MLHRRSSRNLFSVAKGTAMGSYYGTSLTFVAWEDRETDGRELISRSNAYPGDRHQGDMKIVSVKVMVSKSKQFQFTLQGIP